MFKFDTYFGRQTRATSRRGGFGPSRTRRLSLEPIERRLMLSAAPSNVQATLEFEPLNLPSAQPVESPVQSPSEQGGYVLMGSAQHSPSLCSDGVYAMSNSVLSDSIGTWPSTSGLTLAEHVGATGIGGSTGISMSFGTGDLQAVVFVPADGSGGLSPANVPISDHGRGGGSAGEQGGTIRLEPILTSFAPGGTSQSAAALAKRGVKDMADSGSGRPSTLAAASPAADRTIAGEWARAIVFETSSEERHEIEPSVVPSSDSPTSNKNEVGQGVMGPLTIHRAELQPERDTLSTSIKSIDHVIETWSSESQGIGDHNIAKTQLASDAQNQTDDIDRSDSRRPSSTPSFWQSLAVRARRAAIDAAPFMIALAWHRFAGQHTPRSDRRLTLCAERPRREISRSS